MGCLPVWGKVLGRHPCVQQPAGRTWHWALLLGVGWGAVPVIGGLISYQGNQRPGTPLTTPFKEPPPAEAGAST